MVYNYIFFIHFICYWTMVYLYDKNVPINHHRIAILSSYKNQIIYTYPATYLFFYYYPIQYNNILYSFGYLPILLITSDVYFYISHRPLHTKLLYNYHKHHHTGTVCVAKSLDADGFEHVFGNLFSFISGVMFLWYFGYIINIYVLSMWTGIVTINTCISHSNNHCPLDTGYHLNHHKYLKCNYGFGLYLIDKLTGTFKK